MPDFDDYIAYKMSTDSNNNKKTTNSGPGCLGGTSHKKDPQLRDTKCGSFLW